MTSLWAMLHLAFEQAVELNRRDLWVEAILIKERDSKHALIYAKDVIKGLKLSQLSLKIRIAGENTLGNSCDHPAA